MFCEYCGGKLVNENCSNCYTNSAALKEAVATGYPREKMYGVWWSAAEPDVKDVGEAAKGYNGLVVTGEGGKILADIKTHVLTYIC